jgi:signal transduction histidine kinase
MPGPLRILIVDDDQVDRMAVRRLLRQAAIDAEIAECGDPASALQALAAGGLDCVLLDYHLPGVDGVSFLRNLRRDGYSVPVVALTGQGDEELAVELMKAGAADYLNKNTLTAERLQRSLRYALALHQAEEERRLLREREQQARLQAQAANRAKDEFLATLSHELRTPLNAILGWSRMLADGHLDPSTARRAIAIIERNTKLQAQLIDDLLDISRIITGKLRLQLRPVSIRSIVDAALDSVRTAADAKGIAVQISIPDPDATLLCDQARMHQVVWNLLSNAVKFTPEGGRVEVSAAVVNGWMTIAVADNGLGISPAFLPYAFDRFRQQDAATTRVHGGLGLGLSITRHLVELHGGCVEARSDGEGMGSTFTVTLPVSPAPIDEDPEPDIRQESAEVPALGGLRVLVVDSEPEIRVLVAAILEGHGAIVTPAGSTDEAVEAIGRERPDVILSDLVPPAGGGDPLMRSIRALERAGPPIPAAALGASPREEDRARALLDGYQAYVPKPVQPAELTAVVAALTGRRNPAAL